MRFVTFFHPFFVDYFWNAYYTFLYAYRVDRRELLRRPSTFDVFLNCCVLREIVLEIDRGVEVKLNIIRRIFLNK